MNIYALIIVTTLLIDYLVSHWADWLNIKHLSKTLPDEFKEWYDQKEYARSQEYTRVNTKFEFITSTVGLIAILVFWFAGGFNALDMWVRSWGYGELVTGLFYIGLLMLLRGVLSLPFSIYSTFVIEEKFGFNRTTLKTFILDMLKGLLLGLLLGVPLLAGILAFFMYAGEWAWLYAWIVTTVFTLIIQFIAPRWIMPLFNKFDPLEEGELREKIFDYARSVGFSLQNVFVMDGSKRSSKSNAFFTGFGKNKRIALFDTLIEKHTNDELLTVLAHEIGHFKKKHIIKGMITSIVHSGIVFFLLSVFITHAGLFEAFFMENQSVYAGLIFFGMLYSPIEMILSIFMSKVSRKHEYEADRFAVKTTEKVESFITALKKLSVHNLSNLTPHPVYVFLNCSHPPILKRIKHVRNIANTAS